MVRSCEDSGPYLVRFTAVLTHNLDLQDCICYHSIRLWGQLGHREHVCVTEHWQSIHRHQLRHRRTGVCRYTLLMLPVTLACFHGIAWNCAVRRQNIDRCVLIIRLWLLLLAPDVYPDILCCCTHTPHLLQCSLELFPVICFCSALQPSFSCRQVQEVAPYSPYYSQLCIRFTVSGCHHQLPVHCHRSSIRDSHQQRSCCPHVPHCLSCRRQIR